MRASVLAIFAGSAIATPLDFARKSDRNQSIRPQNPSIDGFDRPIVSLSKGGHAACVSGSVMVVANSTKNINFDFQIPRNQTQVTQTFLDLNTAGSTFFQQIAGSSSEVSGTYKIAATLCTPVKSKKPTGVQLLTHGVGFDRSYWDFAPDYSYTDVAAQHGYATFSYDRLGVGESAKPDPIQVIQAQLEVEIAHKLARLLRQAHFGKIPFSKVVGVGHSFGSIITEAVTAQYPDSLDAAILTGFSVNGTAVATFMQGLNLALANHNQPTRFATLNNGFLVSDTVTSNQIGFFHSPGFDPAILQLSESRKGTVTFGELFTVSTASAPATEWTKPVAVVNGAEDLPFCFGNCTYPTNLAAAVHPALYTNVAESDFAVYLAPETGHGLNLHYSAVAAFEFIQRFIARHGLAA